MTLGNYSSLVHMQTLSNDVIIIQVHKYSDTQKERKKDKPNTTHDLIQPFLKKKLHSGGTQTSHLAEFKITNTNQGKTKQSTASIST